MIIILNNYGMLRIEDQSNPNFAHNINLKGEERMSNCPCPCDEEKCETTPVKIVIEELDVACIKLSQFSDGPSFAAQPNASRLGAMAALKYKHCIQMVCEPTIFYAGTARSLLEDMENFLVSATNGEFNSVDVFSSDGQRDYFLNYISNSCHVPPAVCQHACRGQ
jgi:hypothetical protein